MATSRKIERIITRLLLYVFRKAKWFIAGVVLLLALGLWMIFSVGVSGNDFYEIFDASSEIGHSLRVMKKSSALNRMTIEVVIPHSLESDKFVELAYARLQKNPKIVDIKSTVDRFDPTEFTQRLMADCVWEYSATKLQTLKPQEVCRKIQSSLAMPMPSIGSALSVDPLGFAGEKFGALKRFYKLSGLDFSRASEHEKGALSILLMLRLSNHFADAKEAKTFIDNMELELLNCGAKRVMILAPQQHALENEHILRRDISLICPLGLAMFLIIFFFAYRKDFKSLAILAIPVVGAILSLGLMTMFFGKIYWMVIGMGNAIVGIAVDCGIHVYLLRGERLWIRKLARVTLPLLLATLTSAGVFGCLIFSDIEIYKQLGFFACMALLVGYAMSILLLPLFLKSNQDLSYRFSKFCPPRKIKFSVIVYIILMVIMGIVIAKKITFNFDVNSFDGAYKTIAQEKSFDRRWRISPLPAMILQNSSQATLFEENLRMLEAIKVDAFGIASLAASDSLAQKNFESWKSIYESGQLQKYEDEFLKSAQQNGIPELWFKGFFDSIKQQIGSKKSERNFRRSIEQEFVAQNQDGSKSTLILLDDKYEQFSEVRHLLQSYPNSTLVSPASFSLSIGKKIASIFWVIPLFTLVAALIGSTIVFRSLGFGFAVLMPVLFALFCVGTIYAFSSEGMGLTHTISLIILVGLAIDYGILAIYSCCSGDKVVLEGMLLSALTTFVGCFPLIFSQHPVLFHTGVILSVGIPLACLCGVFVVRSIALKHLGVLLIGGALLAITGCRSVSPLPPLPENFWHEVAVWSKQQPSKLKFSAGVVFKKWNNAATMLLHCVIDYPNKQIDVIGLAPQGMKLFQLKAVQTRVVEASFVEFIPERVQNYLREFLVVDLWRMFPDNSLADWEKIERNIDKVSFEKGNEETIFRISPFTLYERKDSKLWQAIYCDDGARIEYFNKQYDYKIVLENIEVDK